MMAFAMTALGALVLATGVAMTQPQKDADKLRQRAEVDVGNLMAYRTAVIRYLNANPSHTGSVPDASVTWETGYVRFPTWQNVVSAGQLYIYSSSAASAEMADTLYRSSYRSALVGVAKSGLLYNPNLGTVSITLPGGIPEGSPVIIGK